MSGPLNHSPADIIRYLLIKRGLGIFPINASDTWPVYAALVPDLPDKVITITDSSPQLDGRLMVDGEVQQHDGFQIAIRTANHNDGFRKANDIYVSITEDVQYAGVTIGTDTYKIYSISIASGIIALGKNPPVSKRNLFTINAIAALKQTS